MLAEIRDQPQPGQFAAMGAAPPKGVVLQVPRVFGKGVDAPTHIKSATIDLAPRGR